MKSAVEIQEDLDEDLYDESIEEKIIWLNIRDISHLIEFFNKILLNDVEHFIIRETNLKTSFIITIWNTYVVRLEMPIR